MKKQKDLRRNPNVSSVKAVLLRFHHVSNANAFKSKTQKDVLMSPHASFSNSNPNALKSKT